MGKTGTLATRPGVTWLVPLAPTEPSDARPCPLPVTALIWLGMVWRPLAVCPLLASVQARFGLEAGDSPGGRGVSGGHYNFTVHTLHWATETTLGGVAHHHHTSGRWEYVSRMQLNIWLG